MLNLQELLPPVITIRVSDVKDDLRLHRLQGREALGELFEYHLDLVNWSESDIVREQLGAGNGLGPEALLGKDLSVTLPVDGDEVRPIHGLITQAAYRESIDHHTSYSVVLRPRLWLLTLSQNCRVFQNKSVPTVVKEILAEHHVAMRLATSESTRTWDTLTQYRETDLAFVTRLLAHEGLYFFFEHGPDEHTLVLADSPSAHQEHPRPVPVGKPKPVSGSDQHLQTWQATVRLQSEAVTLADVDFRLRGQATMVPGQSLAEETDKRLPREIYDFPAGCVFSENQKDASGPADPRDSRAEANRLARVRREASRCRAAGYHGKGTVRWLAPGMLFAVEGCGEQRFLATEQHIILCNPAFLSGQTTIDEPCTVTLTALDGATPFRMPLQDKPRVLGPQTAWVVGEKNEEISTDKYGRIQVHFHWDRERPFEETSSCWVRVAQPWAGHGWGAFSIPRVGSEVVVEFLYGDPDRPLITGSVYGGANLPPYDPSKHKTRSGIRTRSSKGASPDHYNEISFEDDKGKEELHIQAQRNLRAVVKHDQIVQVNGERTVTIKNGDKLHVVGSDKSATIEGSYQVLANKLFNLLVGKDNACSAASPLCSLDLRNGVMTGNADKEIKLECGKASLSLKQDGTIVLSGTHLEITGTADIKATGKGATLTLHETIEAEGTVVQVTGKKEVHLKGETANLDLTAAKTNLTGQTTTVKGDTAVNINC